MTDTLPDFLVNKAMLEGEPFELYLTLNSTTAVDFILDTTNWDWNGDGTSETTPFKDKMLIITGLALESDASGSITFQYLTIDSIECTPLDWYGTTLNASSALNWDGKKKDTSDNFAWPMLTDHWCVPLVCRYKISAKLSGRADGIATVRVRGYAIDRQY